MIYSDVNSITSTNTPLLKDAQAVYQALYTLFNTRKGECLFNPEYGVELEDVLFELMDDLSELEFDKIITESIERFEPRVLIDRTNTKVVSYPDENRYELQLVFSIQGVDSDQQFTLVGNFTL